MYHFVYRYIDDIILFSAIFRELHYHPHHIHSHTISPPHIPSPIPTTVFQVHFTIGGAGGNNAKAIDDLLKSKYGWTDDDLMFISRGSQGKLVASKTNRVISIINDGSKKCLLTDVFLLSHK